jgi:long-chain acyl-CoA synthetase
VVFASFDPCALLRGIEAHRVTSFWLPPVLYAVLVRVANAPSFNLDSFDLSSLRACICAGDSMPAEIRAQFRETFGRELVEVCGMTEVIYSCNPPDHRNRPGSIGRALPGVQMRLVDDCGVEVPRGETGEILAQGPCMMHGYWDDPIATAEALRNGWMHTGDLAWEDEDGYYWFVGRKKDIIIRGGSNISPAEVEDALYTHPAVLAAGVVGRPDPLWGQSVCAFVALKPNADTDEETLIAHLRERLAAYKVPETIRIMPSLPIGLTGKIHRQTLRESAVASLPLV